MDAEIQASSSAPTSSSFVDAEEKGFRIDDLQENQFLEDKTNEAMLVIDANLNILSQLVEFYKSVFSSADCPEGMKLKCRPDFERLETRVQAVRSDMRMQLSRAKSIIRRLSERKTLLFGILEYQNMQASRFLSEKAQISAEDMRAMTEDMHDIARKTKHETVSMRIITLVTLFFLPGTFISTLMSTDIIRWQAESSEELRKTVSLGALQFFMSITIPLMLLTFLACLILNKYRKVFCILLSIGKGQFIENFIPHESLNDSKLPFQAQPADFPQSTESLLEQFRDAQWMFNAVFFEPYRTHLCLSPQHILPILKIEDIKGGEGHSAVVRKVVLHEAHYQLPPSWSANRPGRAFALKTYRPENAKRNFHRECNAFCTLMRNGQCTPGLIGFFGSFIHGDTYNLLLEYADQGTLEDYFHNVSAPWQSDDISSFWSGLSGISKALVAIHGEIEREGDESPIQQG
ncbi:hypothetical protein SLS55_003175 [Diplodia seriata]|uniref:Protein kinase domain-containing protein n=1 Tax=Diplodia seriata TaxID=420778 RepID=A0ABR3CM87_9PEZI